MWLPKLSKINNSAQVEQTIIRNFIYQKNIYILNLITNTSIFKILTSHFTSLGHILSKFYSALSSKLVDYHKMNALKFLATILSLQYHKHSISTLIFSLVPELTCLDLIKC